MRLIDCVQLFSQTERFLCLRDQLTAVCKEIEEGKESVHSKESSLDVDDTPRPLSSFIFY